jgi:quinol monooxygenase YgiN
MTPVTVVAVIRSRPEDAAFVRSELSKLIAPTRQEDGCLNYDLFEDPHDPALFIFHENWVSHAHLDRHLDSPHVQNCLQATDGMLASADVRRLTPVNVQ